MSGPDTGADLADQVGEDAFDVLGRRGLEELAGVRRDELENFERQLGLSVLDVMPALGQQGGGGRCVGQRTRAGPCLSSRCLDILDGRKR